MQRTPLLSLAHHKPEFLRSPPPNLQCSLACQFVLAVSGVPQAIMALQDSFLYLMASLFSGVHHQVPALLPLQAPTMLRQQLRAAALTDVVNSVHSDSMSPTSPRIWEKLSRRCELMTALTEGSARPIQQILIMHLGLLSLSSLLSNQRIQLTTRS